MNKIIVYVSSARGPSVKEKDFFEDEGFDVVHLKDVDEFYNTIEEIKDKVETLIGKENVDRVHSYCSEHAGLIAYLVINHVPVSIIEYTENSFTEPFVLHTFSRF